MVASQDVEAEHSGSSDDEEDDDGEDLNDFIDDDSVEEDEGSHARADNARAAAPAARAPKEARKNANGKRPGKQRRDNSDVDDEVSVPRKRVADKNRNSAGTYEHQQEQLRLQTEECVALHVRDTADFSDWLHHQARRTSFHTGSVLFSRDRMRYCNYLEVADKYADTMAAATASMTLVAKTECLEIMRSHAPMLALVFPMPAGRFSEEYQRAVAMFQIMAYYGISNESYVQTRNTRFVDPKIERRKFSFAGIKCRDDKADPVFDEGRDNPIDYTPLNPQFYEEIELEGTQEVGYRPSKALRLFTTFHGMICDVEYSHDEDENSIRSEEHRYAFSVLWVAPAEGVNVVNMLRRNVVEQKQWKSMKEKDKDAAELRSIFKSTVDYQMFLLNHPLLSDANRVSNVFLWCQEPWNNLQLHSYCSEHTIGQKMMLFAQRRVDERYSEGCVRSRTWRSVNFPEFSPENLRSMDEMHRAHMLRVKYWQEEFRKATVAFDIADGDGKRYGLHFLPRMAGFPKRKVNDAVCLWGMDEFSMIVGIVMKECLSHAPGIDEIGRRVEAPAAVETLLYDFLFSRGTMHMFSCDVLLDERLVSETATDHRLNGDLRQSKNYVEQEWQDHGYLHSNARFLKRFDAMCNRKVSSGATFKDCLVEYKQFMRMMFNVHCEQLESGYWASDYVKKMHSFAKAFQRGAAPRIARSLRLLGDKADDENMDCIDSAARIIDAVYDRANREFFLMMPGNMQLFRELQTSLLGFFLGGSSGTKSWFVCYMPIMVCVGGGRFGFLPSGVNFSELKNCWAIIFLKPNSSGLDQVVVKAHTSLEQSLAYVLTKDGRVIGVQILLSDLASASKLAAERMGAFVLVNEKIEKAPDYLEHMQPYTRCEERGNDMTGLLNSMVRCMPRHAYTESLKYWSTTVEGKRGSSRASAVTVQIPGTGPYQTLLSTNQLPSALREEQEAFQTVTHAVHRVTASTDVVHFKPKDVPGLRHLNPKNFSSSSPNFAEYSAVLAAAPVLARVHVALMNKSGIVDFDICDVLVNLQEMFAAFCGRALAPLMCNGRWDSRRLQGYTARGVSSTVLHTFAAMCLRADGTKKEYDDFIVDVLCNLSVNALTVGDMFLNMHTVVGICLDPNLFTTNFIFIRELDTPVLLFEDLVKFLLLPLDEMQSTTDIGIMAVHSALKAYIHSLAARDSFLKKDGGILPYVSAARVSSMPDEDVWRNSALRMRYECSMSDTSTKSCLRFLSEVIFTHSVYNNVLVNGVGAFLDSSAVWYTLQISQNRVLDPPALLLALGDAGGAMVDDNMGTFTNICQKVNVDPGGAILEFANGTVKGGSEQKGTFLHIFEDYRGSQKYVGMGAHIVTHLLLTSLAQTNEIHSTITDRVAHALLSRFSCKLPRQLHCSAAKIPVRGYDVFADKLHAPQLYLDTSESVARAMPPYFPRPENDAVIKLYGVPQQQTMPSMLTPFMIEDYMEMRCMVQALQRFMGAVELSTLRNLDYTEFPVDFNFVRGRVYPLVQYADLAEHGSVTVRWVLTVRWDSTMCMEQVQGEGAFQEMAEIASTDKDSLHELLRTNNVGLWPLIARPNAVVSTGKHAVGVVQPIGSNFDPWQCIEITEDGVYYNVKGFDDSGRESNTQVDYGSVHDVLLPQGKRVLVDISDSALAPYNGRCSLQPCSVQHDCYKGRSFVLARLSHPIGNFNHNTDKVFVSLRIGMPERGRKVRVAVSAKSVLNCDEDFAQQRVACGEATGVLPVENAYAVRFQSGALRTPQRCHQRRTAGTAYSSLFR